MVSFGSGVGVSHCTLPRKPQLSNSLDILLVETHAPSKSKQPNTTRCMLHLHSAYCIYTVHIYCTNRINHVCIQCLRTACTRRILSVYTQCVLQRMHNMYTVPNVLYRCILSVLSTRLVTLFECRYMYKDVTVNERKWGERE